MIALDWGLKDRLPWQALLLKNSKNGQQFSYEGVFHLGAPGPRRFQKELDFLFQVSPLAGQGSFGDPNVMVYLPDPPIKNDGCVL